jgi:hypothetical protein
MAQSEWLFYDNDLGGPRSNPFDNTGVIRFFTEDPNAENPSLGPTVRYMYVPVVRLPSPTEYNRILSYPETPRTDLVAGSGDIAGTYSPIEAGHPYGQWIIQTVLVDYTSEDMDEVRPIAEREIDQKLATREGSPFVDSSGREYPFTFAAAQARDSRLSLVDRVQADPPGPPTATQLTRFNPATKRKEVISQAEENQSVAEHNNAIQLAYGEMDEAKDQVWNVATTPQECADIVSALDLSKY